DDPDLIFLADTQCCGVTAESVAERPGWADITAVERGDVFSLDEDIASRWGPRIAELVEQIGALLAALPAPETAGGPVGCRRSHRPLALPRSRRPRRDAGRTARACAPG